MTPQMTRRSFVASAIAAGAAGTTAGEGVASAASQVKFLAFADIHYAPGVFPHDDRAWLERVLERADRENVDFVIHAGDFVHNPVRDAEYVKFYNGFHRPTYHTLGNHDTEGCSLAETLAAYRLKRGHYHFDCNGFRFVVLDTNYFREGKNFIHFEGGNYRKIPHERNWLCPDDQYAWAENAIVSAPGPVVVFMHQSCERERDGLTGWQRMRGLFEWINRHKGPKVRLVVNGHHHTDGLRFINSIPYLDLNSANYKYYAQRHRLYPPEYHKTHSGAGSVIAWSDPLSAVITLGIDGTLKIDGMKSTYFHGVSPEKAGFPQRDRPVVPTIQSVSMKLSW